MKTKVTIWVVTIAQFAMTDEHLYNEVRTYLDKDEALKSFNSSKQWLIDYATNPANEDGSFEERTFSAETKNHYLATSDEMIATVYRTTDVNEEFFKGEVRMVKKEFEVDVPIILDIKDIKQIQIFTND